MLTLLSLPMLDSNNPAASADAARLCLDCGLCCNGVLFDRVYLQSGDTPKALTARGLKIKKGQWFNQPCTALCGTLCQLYQNRPVRCRLFQCRQYQEVAAGKISYESAGATIREVKRQVEMVEKLLAPCGGENVRKPLAHRYATAWEAHPEAVATSGLATAMQQLQTNLDQWFRVG